MIWACPIIDVIGRGVAFNNHMGESRAIADLQPAPIEMVLSLTKGVAPG